MGCTGTRSPLCSWQYKQKTHSGKEQFLESQTGAPVFVLLSYLSQRNEDIFPEARLDTHSRWLYIDRQALELNTLQSAV